ncbi:DNA-binding protein [Nonomuraea roseola]|uniref:DNA-binding protein n=1 Tax=Nonomuraea roseola TaxID=46179 RepID=A0ABV5Q7A3_9ACTN
MDPFTPPDPGRMRAHREYASLLRITERHAATEAQRSRQAHADILGPHEAVRLVSLLAGGGAQHEEAEEKVDDADIVAALTLIPSARAEMDQLESALLLMARGRGLTWQDIAFGLGLGTPQAARQRYERLTSRLAVEPGADTP